MGRHVTTSPRHTSDTSSTLHRRTSSTSGIPTQSEYHAYTAPGDRTMQQKSSPMVARHSSQPPPKYQYPKSYTGYSSSSLPADFSAKRYGLASERHLLSSPVHQRRNSVDIGDSQARQKRRDEKSVSSSQVVPGSPSVQRKHKSESTDFLSRSKRGDSVADCLNQSPVLNSFHQPKEQYRSYGNSSDKMNSKTTIVADGDVRRSALHLDPISNQEPLKSTTSSPTSYSSYSVRNKYGDMSSNDTTKTSDSKLPPIVSPTITATSSKSLERVGTLLNNYIRRKGKPKHILRIVISLFLKYNDSSLPQLT